MGYVEGMHVGEAIGNKVVGTSSNNPNSSTIKTSTMDDSDIDDELETAFKAFDLDKDGYITPHELRTGMMNIGEEYTPEEAEEMIKEGDLNNDGKIDYDEFMKIVFFPTPSSRFVLLSFHVIFGCSF